MRPLSLDLRGPIVSLWRKFKSLLGVKSVRPSELIRFFPCTRPMRLARFATARRLHHLQQIRAAPNLQRGKTPRRMRRLAS